LTSADIRQLKRRLKFGPKLTRKQRVKFLLRLLRQVCGRYGYQVSKQFDGVPTITMNAKRAREVTQ
jgi:hypothetical protein